MEQSRSFPLRPQAQAMSKANTGDRYEGLTSTDRSAAAYQAESPPRAGAPRVATLTHASWDDPRAFTLTADRRNRLLGLPTRTTQHAAPHADEDLSYNAPPLPHWRQLSRPRTEELLLDESEFALWSDDSSGKYYQSRSTKRSYHRREIEDQDGEMESKPAPPLRTSSSSEGVAMGHAFERRSPQKHPRDLTADATWTHATKHDRYLPNRQSFESLSSDVSVTGVLDADSDVAQSDLDEATEEAAATTGGTRKKSRYLREMDRRVILERLAKGERQATLAKEFNVSRAAICNLFKHRAVVLARSDENPFAKHPKKKTKPTAKTQRALLAARARSLSSTSLATSDTSLGGTTSAQKSSSTPTLPVAVKSRAACKTLHEVRSPSVQLLVSALSDRSRSLEDFHRACNRVLWLVLEEALSLVPLKEHHDEELSFAGVTVELPPCAISMERQSLEVSPMLDIFHMMEPHQPSGTARVRTNESEAVAEIAAADLPRSLDRHNVFLLDFVSASGEAVCIVIERLLQDHSASEANLTVVALFASSEVVAMVQCKYPSVRIVTARVDSSITRRRVALTAVDLILHRIRQPHPQ